MSGGPSYAAGLQLSGASPISEEERAREQREHELQQREATALIADRARGREDFYDLAEAAGLDATRPALTGVRAAIRERRKARTKGRRR